MVPVWDAEPECVHWGAPVDNGRVSITDAPWTAAGTGTAHVSLVHVPAAVVHALAAGSSTDDLTAYLRGPECLGLWRLRSSQIRTSPADHAWITRLIVDMTTGATVGLAGYHGPPDDRGMVEVGYRVEPVWRRRGYARASLEILLETARDDPRVSIVRATIAPGNAASISLVAQYGFREVGEQWDEEDGLETVFELDVAPSLPST